MCVGAHLLSAVSAGKALWQLDFVVLQLQRTGFDLTQYAIPLRCQDGVKPYWRGRQG
jgi:hypothetical protein